MVALESRHLGSVGLYRIQGRESEIKNLLEAFNSSLGLNLHNRDPEIITGCIKKFLNGLKARDLLMI